MAVQTTGMPENTSPEMQDLIESLHKMRAEAAAKPTTGERFVVPRKDKAGVNVILHRPAQMPEAPLPVVFNLHGGAWIGGDAILMESFCALLAEQLPALVVNVNYTKVDEQPYPYAWEELLDAVLYFAAHAEEYNVDPARMVVGGHSAGAHIALGAAMLLRDVGFPLCGQMLVYPPSDLTTRRDGERADFHKLMFRDTDRDTEAMASPLLAPKEALEGLAPVLMIVCGQDSLRPQGLGYAKRLEEADVPVLVREWPEAQHGFLEVNRPDYPAGDERQNPEQAAMAREAEIWLIGQLKKLWS